MNRVPHCNECDRCKYTQMPWSNTKEYKCYEVGTSEYGAFVGFLGVDHPPKTSPKWCPKRKQRRLNSMTKLNINIKVNEIEEIAPVIESVKKLELNKIPKCNPVVTVELEV